MGVLDTNGVRRLWQHITDKLSTKVNTSILPNDNGEIKTKFRIAHKGYAKSAIYYKLCELPANNNNNYASAIVTGRIGGWEGSAINSINALVWNRGTPNMSITNEYGNVFGTSTVWYKVDLVLYVNGDSASANATATLYAKCYDYYAFDLNLELFQSAANIVYDGTYIETEPTGYLAAMASNCSNRMELRQNKLYVGGKEVKAAEDVLNSIVDTDIKWTNNISVKDSLSPIEIAASNLHNANRFAFANIDGIKIEHSADGGATFSEYNAGSYPQRKAKLISGITAGNGGNFRIGDPVTGTKATVNDQLRITLNATGMNIYTKINKLFLYASTNGALDCTVTVETAAYSTPDTYVNRGTYPIAGWPGWNSIPLYNNFRFNKSGSEVNIRLTFKIGALNSNTSYTNYLTVYNIIALGDTVWASSSNMSKTGHLYDYDYQQNAIFPAEVTATKFIGDGSQLTGIAAGTKATIYKYVE